MIYLLEAEVKLTLPSRSIRFVDTVLSRKILEVYDADLMVRMSMIQKAPPFCTVLVQDYPKIVNWLASLT